jgi:hypothetical protein
VSSTERRVLTAPNPVARAAARMTPDPEQRWMLYQPREVRQSYAEEVHGRPDADLRQQVWMLRQPQAVRESYIAEVLLADPEEPPPRR